MSSFRNFFSLLFLSLVVSCSTDEGSIGIIEDEDEIVKEPEATLSELELEFINEYEYVTFNLAPDSFGATVNEKWIADVKVFLGGELPTNYSAEVEDALAQFNNLLSAGLSFEIVSTIEASNIQLIFGDKEAIREVWPDMFDAIGDVNFKGYALYNRDEDFNIIGGRIWVENGSIPLFRHELGHTIGLGHASDNYCEGDFQTNQSFMCSFLNDDFSPFDKAIIKTLYNPKVEVGLTFSQLKPIIRELLLTDVILVE